ncbi:hypothetical protein P879_06048 [Paragonimus westermani]|uniref:O-acyltransferase WSD1 C-terminal domain-containing protein n=1 Tax=Paragonimus westermani TaxID=34504 RepID=A0A8T0CYI8_9TREM|nr:hypothetical protein P879_06048 [Paragonimus westermani]
MSGDFVRPLIVSNASSFTTPTGSKMSHQPPGSGSFASLGAGHRATGSSDPLPPHSSGFKSTGVSPPIWLSTSSRPIGSGSHLMSPSTSRVTTPPQPPPLPPPPPSPQLVPLKARLARSKSIAAQPYHHHHHPPLGSVDRTFRKRWDVPNASSRRTAFGQGPSRSLKEPLSESVARAQFDSDGQCGGFFQAIPKGDTKHSDNTDTVPLHFQPGVFSSIAHPRERNPITVCLANLVFLSLSVLVTSVFSILVLPFCLLAYVIRRLGLWFANLFQRIHCCRCNKPQLRTQGFNPFVGYLSRFVLAGQRTEDMCQCLCGGPDERGRYTPQPLRPLTAAELRWLPRIECKPVVSPSHPHSLLCFSPSNSPLIVICLRFGAPGVQLTKLREVIANRLLNRYSTPSSLSSSPRGSSISDRWVTDQTRQRACSSIPPADALSRLTQCLTCLSTGYAWRECLAFRLEDHVIHVPATCLPQTDLRRPKLHRSSSSSEAFETRKTSQPQAIKVETMVESLSKIPLLLNRPLWQAYLLEQYQEVDDNEPSDADSAAESGGEEDTRSRRWPHSSDRGSLSAVTSRRQPKFGAGSFGTPVRDSHGSSFVCRRSGSVGIGSLVIFRLHATLSDDGKALVHLLTNCLADLPSRTQSPQCTSSNPAVGDHVQVENEIVGPGKRRWRGPVGDSERAAKGSKTSDGNVSGGPDAAKCTTSTDALNPQVIDTNAPLQHNPQVTQSTAPKQPVITTLNEPPNPNSVQASTSPPLISPSFDDDDPEDSEASQWWYTFWSSSLATIATCCDLVRALLTGPAIILHKYFFTRADMGILAKIPSPSRLPSLSTSDSTCQSDTDFELNRRVYRCTLLSLVKLSRVRQVTKASYSEIILSLLAGGLRAYHQTIGLKHPPDLLAFLSVEVPVLPGLQPGSSQQLLDLQGCDASPCSGIARLWSSQQEQHQPSAQLPTHSRTSTSIGNSSGRRNHPDSLVETGLIGNDHRMVALTSPPSIVSSLCPGRHVLADICLPLNTEGMLPRLWETRQRLIELNKSVDPLCLAWARTVLYTLLPHPLVNWIETSLGSSAKASVSVTGVEVVSPFGCYSAGGAKDHDSIQTYQMPPTRRLAYMSLLASKSAEARCLRRRLRKRLPRGALVYPPRLGTSFRAIARHLTNANAGLVYIGGSPVVRIDTWMPSPRLVGHLIPVETGVESSMSSSSDGGMKWMICRDLSVAFTTYAGQLSLTFSANAAMDYYPSLDLITHAMRIQLRKMCRLLAGRHVPTPTDRWLSRGSALEHQRTSASVAVNLSPSLNPTLVLHHDSSPKLPVVSVQEQALTSGQNDLGSRKLAFPSPSSSPSLTANPIGLSASSHQSTHKPVEIAPPGKWGCVQVRSGQMTPIPMTPVPSQSKSTSSLWSDLAYASQFNQPTEQLQDRLRWVQQKLNDAANVTHISKNRLTEQELTSLRTEFCALLRELKQRCSLGLSSNQPDINRSDTSDSRQTIDHAHVAALSQEGSLFLDTDPRNRRLDNVRKCSAERILPTVVKAKTVDSDNVNTSAITLGGGDFDEDPDFYIDDCDEEEDEFDDGELMVESPSPRASAMETRHSPLPSSKIMASTDVQPSDTITNMLMLPQRSDRWPREMKTATSSDHRPRRKRRRTSVNSSGHRRSSSLLPANLTSLDLTPNRRGSLGASSGVPGAESLLVKLVKPKLTSALFSGSADARGSKQGRK